MNLDSSFRFKIGFNLYPPLLFNRTRCLRVTNDFLEADVKLRFSLLNRNFNGSTFGGSIFMASDPYYPFMYRAALSHRHINAQAWLKQAEISYLKPAHSDLLYQFKLTLEDLNEAETSLKEKGRFQNWNTVEAVDEDGKICARVRLLSFLRNGDN